MCFYGSDLVITVMQTRNGSCRSAVRQPVTKELTSTRYFATLCMKTEIVFRVILVCFKRQQGMEGHEL